MSIVYFSIIILLSSGTGIARGEKVENEWEKGSVGILNDLINKTLESFRPHLVNIEIPYENIETGPQEIGMLEGHLREVKVRDLDKFQVEKIVTGLLDINNLTVVEERFSAEGHYSLNGTLAFPLGKEDIVFYGDGRFGAEFQNFSISMKVKVRYENGRKVVKDLDLNVGLQKLKIYLHNLMGGGDLEEVFNKLLNDVGLTVFNYYKGPIIDDVKCQIREIINEMLNPKEDAEITAPSSQYNALHKLILNSVNNIFGAIKDKTPKD